MQPLGPNSSLSAWIPALKQRKAYQAQPPQVLPTISLSALLPFMKQRKVSANVTAGQLLEVTQKYELKLQSLEKQLTEVNGKLVVATTDKESLKKELKDLLVTLQKEKELYNNEKEALKKALESLSTTQSNLQSTDTALQATQADLQSTKAELEAMKETLSKMTIRMDNSDAQTTRILNLFMQATS